MEGLTPKAQLAKIRDYEQGFFAMHVINVGANVNMFDVLLDAKEGITTPELAARLDIDPAYTKTWCETAYHFELLECDDEGRFRFAPFMDEILGDRSNMRNYLNNSELAIQMGKGTPEASRVFKSGEVLNPQYEPWLSSLVAGLTQNVYLAFLYIILPQNKDLAQRLEQGIGYLDVGCGHGNLVVQLALAFPQSRFVGVDCDAFGIEEARRQADDLALSGRVSFESIGGEALAYENEFEMASMIATLHEILPGVREEAIDKTYTALKPGGQLLVLDFPYPSRIEDFRNPAYNFAIIDQYFERFAGIVHLNTDERDELLMRAGFGNLRKMEVGKGMFELLIAEKG